MWFWWFMFVCDVLIPVTMIIAGRMMWKHCPQKINSIYGYRTSRSMKNMDTWHYAHDYCGRLCWKIGWFILIPSVLIPIPFFHSHENVIGVVSIILCILQCVVLIVSIYQTEMALKRTFSDDGSQR